MYPSRPKRIIFINTLQATFKKCYDWMSSLMKEKMKRRVWMILGYDNIPHIGYKAYYKTVCHLYSFNFYIFR